MPELSSSMAVEWDVYLTKKLDRYDMIIGRDLLSEIGILLDFKNHLVKFEHVEVPMIPAMSKE